MTSLKQREQKQMLFLTGLNCSTIKMQINLWYNESMKEWRWTLIDSEMNMESGGQPDLRLAMNDVATTVEYLIGKED